MSGGGFDAREFLADYLTEAADHLGALEDGLLDAERSAGEGRAPGDDQVNAIFRAIHTLKGMAGMMGFGATAALAHEVEQLFDEVRQGSRRLRLTDYGPIFEALDAFQRLQARIEATGGEGGEDVGAAAAAIGALVREGAAEEDPYEAMARMVAEAKRQVAAEAAGEAVAGPPAPDLPTAGPPPVEPSAVERATSVRVETTRLDRLLELVGELVIHHTRLARLSAGLSQALDGRGSLDPARASLEALAEDLAATMEAVDQVADELQDGTMRVRMVPVRALFNRFPRIVRDLARDCGKAARLEVIGADTELDKTVVEQLGDPLIHLLRNSVDHGLEPAGEREAAGKPAEGMVRLTATQQGGHIVIGVEDDGRGIDRARVLAKARALGLVGPDEAPGDQEVFQLIFRPGFSTAAAITSISGRGVGMDVVLQNIRKLGGQILVDSAPGRGARFTVRLPLTLAIAKALLVRAGGRAYAVPLAAVEETLRVRPADLRAVGEHEVLDLRGRVVPVFRLAELLGDRAAVQAGPTPLVVVGDGERRLGLIVDGFDGQQDVVVKPLGDYLGPIPGVGGATILGDGRVALIVDVATVLDAPSTRTTSRRV